MDKIEYTQEELTALLQKEGDKRVTSALATREAKFKTELEETLAQKRVEWEEEYSKKAKLSAEELAKQELLERTSSLDEKEKSLNLRENMILAKSKLAEAGVPKEQYENMVGILVTDNLETSTNNVDKFIDGFKKMSESIETNVKKQYSQVPPPTQGNNGGEGMTKEKFSKLSYGEMLTLKQENPDLYNTLKK